MNIRRKMVKIINYLGTLPCVLVGISLFRICEMDKKYKDLTL